MSRPFRARAIAAVLALVAAGCQNYNFNPVGHCLIQPGTQRFTLSNVSSADVLFVVDDSGSMAGKQTRLASAFDDFVTNLTSTNVGRAQAGLLPIDFHIATTTTSVFFNPEPLTNQTCRSDCAGANGQLACCNGTSPVYGPKPCTADAQCTVAGTACRNICNGLKGEGYCCAANGTFPPDSISQVGGAIVRCSLAGQACGALETHYDFAGQCPAATQGVALDQLPFPDGAFVGSTNVASAVANPRVLHSDKRLYLSADGKNAQGFTMAQLKTFFRQNVAVGTCGSAQEQGFTAAKDALVKAFAGTQLDTYLYDRAAGQSATGAISTVPRFTVLPGGIPIAQATASWPGPDSKLVLVWVGDEDDCSSQKDPAAGVMLLNTDQSGADACVRDSTTPAPLGGKEFAVSSFVDYFTSLGRKLGAAFVVSARSTTGDPTTCSNDTCVANATVGNCCDPTCPGGTCPPQPGNVCGGQAPGTRFLEAYSSLRDKGADVVAGSVCGDFRPILDSVAEIVKPPQTLSLPSLPAEERITILRIGTPSETRKICGRPLAPTQPNYTRQQAEATGADWWFTKSADPGPPWDANGTATVAVPTQFVYINPNGSCKANPGETYSADYLGVVPPEGCSIDKSGPGTDPLGALDCQAKLGGQPQDWECFIPPGLTTGTCTCTGG